MWKSFGLVAIGVVAGAALVMFVYAPQTPQDSQVAERTLAAPDVVLTEAEVEAVRSGRFESIRTIQDVLSLPTQFARDEAMYTLAGRSDAGELQALIFEGDRVNDAYTRRSLLGILFRRLAEVDPQSALALARVEPYGSSNRFENTIWRTWARNDLDSAIFEVKTQSQRSKQVAAAQILYEVYGYMGNETTKRIESELGIEPNRQTRLRFLRTLLEQSPDHVIDFIGEEPSALRRKEYINWFVYAIEESRLAEAEGWSDSFASTGDMSLYKQILEDRIARLNPLQSLQAALNSRDFRFDGTFQNAMQELASSDMDAALGFYEGIDNLQAKNIAAYLIVTEMALTDPSAALQWVDASDAVAKPQLYEVALGVMAETDPRSALEKAAALPGEQKQTLMSSILLTVATRDSVQAMTLIEALPAGTDKRSLRSNLGRSWLMQDTDRAIEWLKNIPEDEASQIADRSAPTIARMQPQKALNLLPFVTSDRRQAVLERAVMSLAASGDMAAARSLVADYSAEEGISAEFLEVNMIAGLAQRDIDTAEQLALQMQNPASKDKVLARVVMTAAGTNPSRAASMLANIDDAGQRERALRQLSIKWVRSDAEAAQRWVRSLSSGEDRVRAVTNMTRHLARTPDQGLALIESVTDAAERNRLKANFAIQVARLDKDRAASILEGTDLTDEQLDSYRRKIGQDSGR